MSTDHEKALSAARSRKYRAAHPEKEKARGRQKYRDDPETNKDRAKQWAKDNPGKAAIIQKRSRAKNPDKYRAIKAKCQTDRRAAKLSATPAWADSRYIKLFYVMAQQEAKRIGEDVEVDHIVPLNHDLVCGLHCEDNLQLLTAAANLRKSNSFGAPL